MIYLLHFSAPLGDPSRPRMSARHYLGWAADLDWQDRVNAHRAGRGAAITRAAVAAGIELELVRLWPGEGRVTERRLKRAGHFADRRCGPSLSQDATDDLAAPPARRLAVPSPTGLHRGW